MRGILFTNVKLWGPKAWGIVVEQLATKVKSNMNCIEVNAQLSNNINAMDDATMVASSLCQKKFI
jgi:hypothetical protein